MSKADIYSDSACWHAWKFADDRSDGWGTPTLLQVLRYAVDQGWVIHSLTGGIPAGDPHGNDRLSSRRLFLNLAREPYDLAADPVWGDIIAKAPREWRIYAKSRHLLSPAELLRLTAELEREAQRDAQP